MRHIEKKAEPDEFTQWKGRADEHWKPGWGDFDGKPIKQVVKRALLNEQGYLCCYCEDRVDESDGHIEHIVARNAKPELALRYDNILYCCKETPRGIPVTCGHARKADDPVPVSPLDPNCESRFSYTPNGKMQPSSESDIAAGDTIRILNLNTPLLCRKREQVYKEIEESRKELSDEDFHTWLKMELARDKHNRFTPFWGTKKYVADRTG